MKTRERLLEEGFGRQLWHQKMSPGPCWKYLGRVLGCKLAPKQVSQAMDEGGGTDDTKEVENVRPRIPFARGELVPENEYLGSGKHEKRDLPRVFCNTCIFDEILQLKTSFGEGTPEARMRLPLRRRVIFVKNRMSKMKARKGGLEAGLGRRFWLEKQVPRQCWRVANGISRKSTKK